MVNVSIDLKDTSGYAPALGDRVIFEAKRLAGSETTPGRVITTAPVEVQLRNGVGQVDLEPGTTVMRVKARNYRDARAIEFDVPAVSRSMTLRELLEDAFTYSPPVIQEAQLYKVQAREAAKRAEAAAAVVGSAQRVGEWADASEAASKASKAFAGAAKESSEASAKSAAASAGSASEAEQSASSAASSAATADSHAKRAGSHANEAGAHASAAGESASAASGSAGAAAGSADKAKSEADRATGQARAASTSAGEAKTHADRAEGVVDTVRWDDDKLTVAGKTSPSLRGPRGPKGDQGDSGASTWDAITGKPDLATRNDLIDQGLDYRNALQEKADKAHKHRVADITDLPAISDSPTGNTLVRRSSAGTIRVADPNGPNNAANQGYVDRQDKATLAEARALVETRPKIQLVTTPSAVLEDDVLYVIPE